ncbi:HD domain-containing protein [Streptomyces fructofermentans]|uniref:HD domain-containing protein n=1 Tax=Streptomyces fructofermentans TaxID=152141 RepID=UPI0033F1479F
MEPRSVEELMDLLHACRGAHGPAGVPSPRARPWGGGGEGGGAPSAAPPDLHEHALQTAALLRRSRPADKELQAAGLVHVIGRLLRPHDTAGQAGHAADAVRPLLGERVAHLVRLHREDPPREPVPEDVQALRQADESARTAGTDAGVLEDWRTVLELLAARHARLGAVDRHARPLSPDGPS